MKQSTTILPRPILDALQEAYLSRELMIVIANEEKDEDAYDAAAKRWRAAHDVLVEVIAKEISGASGVVVNQTIHIRDGFDPKRIRAVLDEALARAPLHRSHIDVPVDEATARSRYLP